MEKHGAVNLHWEDDLLIVELVGEFNVEGATHVAESIKRSVLSQNKDSWQRIVSFSEASLGGPEALKISIETNKWQVEHGCTAVAVLIKNSLQREAYRTQNINTEFFTSIIEAKRWLKTQRDLSSQLESRK